VEKHSFHYLTLYTCTTNFPASTTLPCPPTPNDFQLPATSSIWGIREAKEECQEERILVNGGHGQKTTAADIDEFYE
jgi:hypothetical protein